jgi:hypothetical protein
VAGRSDEDVLAVIEKLGNAERFAGPGLVVAVD